MSSQELFAFFLFSVTAAVTPGPANVLVMSAGLRAGVRGGLPSLGGVVVSMGLLVGASGAGLGALLLANPGATVVMRWAGAAVLLWLSWKIATAPALRAKEMPDPVGFWRALLFQWVNPKAWVIGASAAATYGAAPGVPVPVRAALLGGTFMLAAAPSVGLWLVCGAALQRMLSDDKKARILNKLMGLTLAASVVLLFL
jgi:threonine/homoserine/homoserine lactone efflux protein